MQWGPKSNFIPKYDNNAINYISRQSIPVLCLHCAVHIPESEDGGSLLGSSRKSLADTSVTSTADLSVFSGGQRSQQAFDICVDDNHSVRSEGADCEGNSPE